MKTLVEVVKARTGRQVIKKNGKYLSSSIDPVSEAQAWALNVSSRCKDAQSVFLLGAGGLYHALALSALIEQRLLVIDPDLAVTKLAESMAILDPSASDPSSINRAPGKIKFVYAATPVGIVEDAGVRDALLGTHITLVHAASAQQQPDFYAEVERIINGRDPAGFLLQLKMRPELCAILDPKAIQAIFEKNGSSLVSIKTLQKLFIPGNAGLRERRIWRALEELVR